MSKRITTKHAAKRAAKLAVTTQSTTASVGDAVDLDTAKTLEGYGFRLVDDQAETDNAGAYIRCRGGKLVFGEAWDGQAEGYPVDVDPNGEMLEDGIAMHLADVAMQALLDGEPDDAPSWAEDGKIFIVTAPPAL